MDASQLRLTKLSAKTMASAQSVCMMGVDGERNYAKNSTFQVIPPYRSCPCSADSTSMKYCQVFLSCKRVKCNDLPTLRQHAEPADTLGRESYRRAVSSGVCARQLPCSRSGVLVRPERAGLGVGCRHRNSPSTQVPAIGSCGAFAGDQRVPQ